MATVFYKDLSLDFTPHPVSGDVRPVTDEVAIKRSLSNLLKTRRGTRPFRPDYGSDVYKYAFSSGIFAESQLNESVYNCIKKFEPRVNVTKIKSTIGENSVEVIVDYNIINTNIKTTLETTIKKVS
jgi:phage baseplate assembly protein W